MINKDVPLQSIEEDNLGVRHHVNALSNFIRDAETPITIAIQGEWGSGKTSFMRMLESNLCSELIPERERFDSLWINSWEMFLENDYEGVVRRLIMDILSQFGNHFDQLRKKNARDRYADSAKEALRTAASVFLDVYNVEPKSSERLMELLLPEKRRSVTRAKKEFEDFIVRQVEGENGITRKGFIVFIDDLDRLDPRIAVMILEALKNLFDINKCVFVVAIDYEVVSAGVRQKYGALEGNIRDLEKDFFDKLIQLPYTIPMRYYDISEMVMENLRSINFFEEQVDYGRYQTLIEDVFTLATRKNPRSIKRLLNMMQLILTIQRGRTGVRQAPVRVLELTLIALQLAFPAVYSAIAAQRDLVGISKDFSVDDSAVPTEEEKAHYQLDTEWKELIFRITSSNGMLEKNYGRIARLVEIYLSLKEVCKKTGIDTGEAFGIVGTVFKESNDDGMILYSGTDYDKSSTTQYIQGTRLISEIDFSGHDRVLDAGCGNGMTTIELWKMNPSMRIDAVDISDSQIRVAKDHYCEVLPEMKDAVGSIDFDVMDLMDLDAVEKYDLVFSNATMHWVPDPKVAYEKLYDSLQWGGELAVHQGGAGTYQGLHEIVRTAAGNVGLGKKLENFRFPAFYPEAEELENMLSEIGFKNIHIDVDRTDGSESPDLVDNFAHASIIFYKGAGLSDSEFEELNKEYFRLCEEGPCDKTTVRLYIHAVK